MTLTCEICGGTDIRPTGLTNVTQTGCDLVRCADCQVRFYDRSSLPAGVWEFYNSPAYDAYTERQITTGTAFKDPPHPKERYEQAVKSVFNQFLAGIREIMGENRPRNLYEIGCAFGNMLTHALEAGIRPVAGCDLGRENVAQAVAAGFDVEHSTFQEATVPFDLDCIIANDVVEHTETPGADLRKAFKHLRPGGVIALKTFYEEWHSVQPDLDITKPGTQGYYGRSHLWHFDLRAILNALELVGFKPMKMTISDTCGQVSLWGMKP